MSFSRIRWYQFRNLIDDELGIDNPNVCFVGRNGQGKTNVLEAVYLLCYGSSFRTRQDSLLIRHGSQEMAVSASVQTRDDDLLLDVRIQNGKKIIQVDNSAVQDRKDLIQNIPCIVFCHDDLEFVNGAPDRKRWFFNQTMSMGEPLFIDYLRNYNRILKSRNQTLKDGRKDLLNIYDGQLADAGMAIIKKRKDIIRQFNSSFYSLFREISELPYDLSIDYKTNWNSDAGVDGAVYELERRREMDFRLGTTSSGPHRDKFIFSANGMDFTNIASTGQLRLLGLILRVAQARYLADLVGRKPVLLLDDVLLELDPQRRRKFMEFMPEYRQAFYTFLPDEHFSQYIQGDTMVYRVENGQFRLQ